MTDARVTQTAVEQWGQGAPAAQVTQAALEVWGGITAGPRVALVTQLALEEWAPVPVVVPPVVIRGNVAVTINTG